MGKNQHVIPWSRKEWAVRGEGNRRITSRHPTQQTAFVAARQIAVHQGSDVLIHGRDNEVRIRRSYGGVRHRSRTTSHTLLLVLQSTTP